MLIIKSDANSLKGVEQFLRNRDWSLSTTHQMKDAILFLTKNKPSFVLITVDHSNPKIRKLPKIVSSAFPCCVMVYAEKATTSSFKLLMDSGIEYKINPPVTGPAIERAVNKFIRDREQAAKQQSQALNGESGKNNFEFKVEIKGGERDSGSANFQTTVVDGGAGATDGQPDTLALNLLAQLNSDDWDAPKNKASGAAGFLSGSTGSAQNKEPGTHDGANSAKQKNPNGEVINLKKDKTDDPNEVASNAEIALEIGTRKKNSKGEISYEVDPNPLNPKAPGTLGSNGSLEKAPGSLDPNDQLNKTPGLLNSKGKSAKGSAGENSENSGESGELGASRKKQHQRNNKNLADISIGKAQGRNSKLPPETPNPEAAEDIYVPPKVEENNSAKPIEEAAKQRKDIILGREIDELASKRKEQADSLRIKQNGNFEKDSVFVKGVNQALDDTVSKGSGIVDAALEDNSHLACIIVESVRFSGYLVAALGKDKKIDNQFVDLVRSKLTKFLTDNGEPMENEGNMQIKVRRVDFEGWALEYAQFLRKSVHKGDEVAMAFFPFAEAKTNLGESASEKMVSVKTDEIQTDVPLEFNMYIYLPSNKKYILYTPEGGKFLAEQKKRLLRQGVSKMHIQKDDVQNLGRFKAQNHLNSLIEDYEDKKADPTQPLKKKKTG